MVRFSDVLASGNPPHFCGMKYIFKYLRGSDQPHPAKQGFDIPGSVNLYVLV